MCARDEGAVTRAGPLCYGCSVGVRCGSVETSRRVGDLFITRRVDADGATIWLFRWTGDPRAPFKLLRQRRIEHTQGLVP